MWQSSLQCKLTTPQQNVRDIQTVDNFAVTGFSRHSVSFQSLFFCAPVCRYLCTKSLLFSISVDDAFRSCLYWQACERERRHDTQMEHKDTHSDSVCPTQTHVPTDIRNIDAVSRPAVCYTAIQLKAKCFSEL
jgi:hypothetical protein